MLTTKNVGSLQAINYFTQSYSDTFQTRWYGKGASQLNLPGEIKDRQVFASICKGLAPDGSGRLGRERSRAAIDCTFSAPKSVSLCALVGGDERLVTAHQEAVEKALSVMEKQYAQTRIRTNNDRSVIKTANLVVAQFDHLESRELDPHLHTHALVMNLTKTPDGSWYSLHNGEIYQNKKNLGMVYQNYLAAKVQKLGYEVEERGHGQFEIKGYQKQDLVKFSKRRQQIIAEVGAEASWESRDNAWNITRKSKQIVEPEELRKRWQEEALNLGLEPVKPSIIKIEASQHYKQEKAQDLEQEWEMEL